MTEERFYIVYHDGNHGRQVYRTRHPEKMPLTFAGADRWEEVDRDAAFRFIKKTCYTGEPYTDMFRRLIDLDAPAPSEGSKGSRPNEEIRKAIIDYAREGLMDKKVMLAMFISLIESVPEHCIDIAMEDAGFELDDCRDDF